MGLISAALGAASGALADSWRDYFYCDSLPNNVLLKKADHRQGRRSTNTKGDPDIISNGSIVAVADGQCMIIVDQGKIAELCAEPGEFVYDTSTEPSIFSGSLGAGILETFKNIGKRFTFGGEPPKDQRVYYFNTKELIGNKYGTPSPVPFRVVDNNVGLDMDIAIRCFGEYSYHVCDPILFYTNVSGNVSDLYTRDKLDGQLKTELLTALQPAFSKISDMGIRYSALPGHTLEMADALNEVLSSKWRNLRGIEIVSFGVSSVKASEEDEAMIKQLQKEAARRNVLKDANSAAAEMAAAQADAMRTAAANSGGAAIGFMGMNMAQGAGGLNANQLYQMSAQQPAPAPAPAPAPTADSWTCPSCGATVSGKFCPECGAKKPEPKPVDGWTCPTCGAVNKGKFCAECGTKKPAGIPQYKCDKCGWEPADPTKPPKFCPECGDPFDDGDIQ